MIPSGTALSAILRSSVFLASTAVLGGVLAAASAHEYLTSRAEALREVSEKRFALRPIIVARHELRAGERLGPEMLAVRGMPAQFLPAQVFDGSEAAALIGRRLLHGLHKGEPVQGPLLQTVPTVPIQALLPAGRRALTVAVDELNAHSGLLRAGDRVDLYLSRDSLNGQTRLDLLLEQVHVLATGGRTAQAGDSTDERRQQDVGTVTLLVDAEQAGRIVLAESVGQLTFVLRPESDDEGTRLPALDTRSLLPSLSRRPVGRDSTDVIELLLGGEGGPVPRRSWLQTTRTNPNSGAGT